MPVPRRVARAVVDGHAVELLRQRLRREDAESASIPRRSGDVVVNLMPGCIEERPDVRSKSGSMYGYDTTVPLVLYGGGIPAAEWDAAST